MRKRFALQFFLRVLKEVNEDHHLSNNKKNKHNKIAFVHSTFEHCLLRMLLHTVAAGSSLSKALDQSWISPCARDYSIKATCNFNIWTCTACACRVGNCVVCVWWCGCVVLSCSAVKALWQSKYWEPTNLIPVRLIPACLQRRSDYQKGEALVCWHCRALCQQACSRANQIWTHCRIWEDGSVCFTASEDVFVTANDWGSIFSQIVNL